MLFVKIVLVPQFASLGLGWKWPENAQGFRTVTGPVQIAMHITWHLVFHHELRRIEALHSWLSEQSLRFDVIGNFFFRRMSVCLSVGSRVHSFLSDIDVIWHTYSLIFILDFVESFFDMGENKWGKGEKFALATVFNGFL